VRKSPLFVQLDQAYYQQAEQKHFPSIASALAEQAVLGLVRDVSHSIIV
jgi:hypothetical protein